MAQVAPSADGNPRAELPESAGPTVNPSASDASPATTNSAGAGQNTSAPGGSAQLGEIVVTAQRRSENLQRAAVSVGVVSGTSLVGNGITDTSGLGFLVPGLTVSGTNYFLRGVGNFTVTPYADPAVAFNYDSVYIGRPTATTGPLFDLERVEVLKGPQGTLYGINATGGAINVIPTKPQLRHLGAYGIASYGNYHNYNLEGGINLPIGQNSALRVSGAALGHRGYLSDRTSDQKAWGGRAQFLTQPSSDLSIRIAADYAHLGGVGQGSSVNGTSTFNRATGQYSFGSTGLGYDVGLYDARSQALFQTAVAGPSGRRFNAIEQQIYNNNTLYGANAEINLTTGAGRLTFIPAWRHATISNLTAAPGFLAGPTPEHDDQYSAELRFAGNRIGVFDYTLGGLIFHEKDRGHFTVDQQYLTAYQDFDSRTTSYSAFGRLTAHVTDQLRVVGGVRYTDSEKRFNGFSERLLIVCALRVAGVPTCPRAPLFQYALTPSGQPLPVPTTNGGVAPIIGTGAIVSRGDVTVNAPQNTRKVTWRAALEYDVAPHSLAYASVETGFRAGGFSLSNGYETYQPETITAYTVGLKNRFLDNRIELNLELFDWEYRNQQISHLGVDLAGQTGNFTQNVGRSTNRGAEVEGRFLLTHDTVLNANVQYLHAKYKSFAFQVPPTAGVPPLSGCAVSPVTGNPALDNVDCSGQPAFNSPKWTVNLGAQQTFHLGGLKLDAVADTQYKTGRFVGFDYVAPEYQRSSWQTNAQLVLSPENGVWTVAAFVRNIENHRLLTNSQNFGGFFEQITAPPRTYGVRASFKF